MQISDFMYLNYLFPYTHFLNTFQKYPDQPITEMDQPLLEAKPNKKIRRRAVAGENVNVFLVPEMCHLTGITEAMNK